MYKYKPWEYCHAPQHGIRTDEALKSKLTSLDLLAESEGWDAPTLEKNTRKVCYDHHITALNKVESYVGRMADKKSFDKLRQQLEEKYGDK